MAGVTRSPLVTVKWLSDMIKSKAPNHRIVDASWFLPSAGRIAEAEYKEKHIPGAVFFDIDACADKSTQLPHMIPSSQAFEDYVSALGINNDTHIIIYDNSPQFPLFSAQRVWWTFRVFGHNKISLLEGGLPKWIAENGPLTKDVTQVTKEKFTAKFNPKLVKTFEDIKKNIKSSEFTLVDARPEGRFKGTAPEPRADTKPGCIPNCANVPFMKTMNVETRTMRSTEELKTLFKEAGVDLSSPVVATCGSGVSACMLALAAYLCGKEDVAVYDGSWTEWYKEAPADLKLNVPA